MQTIIIHNNIINRNLLNTIGSVLILHEQISKAKINKYGLNGFPYLTPLPTEKIFKGHPIVHKTTTNIIIQSFFLIYDVHILI